MGSEHLDIWILDARTLNIWTPGLWTLGLWANERSGGLCTGVFRIFTTTVEHLNFTEQSQLLQIFTGLSTEKISFFIDKANENLKSKT